MKEIITFKSNNLKLVTDFWNRYKTEGWMFLSEYESRKYILFGPIQYVMKIYKIKDNDEDN